MATIIYRYEVDGITRYVGSTFERWYKIRQKAHLRNIKAKKDIDADRVVFVVIEKCEDSVRYEREWFHIEWWRNSGNDIWNISDPRKQFPASVTHGGRLSDEARKKISERLKGKPNPTTAKRNIGNTYTKGKPSPLRGRKQPKISEALKGRPNPAVSAALKGRKRPDISERSKGKQSPRKGIPTGKHHSEEHRRKISEGLKGNVRGPHSDEAKKKISIAKKGKANPHKGYPLSDETRKRMSEAQNAINDLKREIQQEFQCSWKEAGEILKIRRSKNQ